MLYHRKCESNIFYHFSRSISRQSQSHGINFATSYEETILFTSISFAIFFHHFVCCFFSSSYLLRFVPFRSVRCFNPRIKMVWNKNYIFYVDVSLQVIRSTHSVRLIKNAAFAKMRMEMIGMPKMEWKGEKKKEELRAEWERRSHTFIHWCFWYWVVSNEKGNFRISVHFSSVRWRIINEEMHLPNSIDDPFNILLTFSSFGDQPIVIHNLFLFRPKRCFFPSSTFQVHIRSHSSGLLCSKKPHQWYIVASHMQYIF